MTNSDQAHTPPSYEEENFWSQLLTATTIAIEQLTRRIEKLETTVAALPFSDIEISMVDEPRGFSVLVVQWLMEHPDVCIQNGRAQRIWFSAEHKWFLIDGEIAEFYMLDELEGELVSPEEGHSWED